MKKNKTKQKNEMEWQRNKTIDIFGPMLFETDVRKKSKSVTKIFDLMP